jgi:hypothetical protein
MLKSVDHYYPNAIELSPRERMTRVGTETLAKHGAGRTLQFSVKDVTKYEYKPRD